MNNRKNISSIFKSLGTFAIVAILVLTSSTAFGQGWEKFYGDTNTDEGRAVVQTRDGGFAVAGYTLNKTEVIRTDQNGNVEWRQTYEAANLSVSDAANDIIETSDGGFLIAGTNQGGGTFGQKDCVLRKLDRDGVEQWVQYYGDDADDEAYSVIQTADGGYAFAGYSTQSNDQTQAYIVRTDAVGNIIWDQLLGGVEDDQALSIFQTADSGFIVSGKYETGSGNDTDIYLIKLDFSGLVTWENQYHQSDNNVGNDVVELPDGSFICAGVVNSEEAILLKTDAAGNSAFWFTYGSGSFNALQITTDGNLVMTGIFETSIEESNVYLVKTNYDGNQIWSQTFGRVLAGPGILISSGADVQNTLDGGYVIAGYSAKVGAIFDFDTYIIKTNSLGEIYTNYIEGKVFDDFNENCIQDAGEPSLEGWVVEAAGDQSFYGTTDENGEYAILVANGTYDVSLIKPSEFYKSCANTINTTLAGPYDTIQLLFPVQEISDCPLMQVDISAPILEKCQTTDYTVAYRNLGTVTATDAEVKVNLDEFLIFNSAEIPYTNETIDGDLYYVFDVGDVDPLQSERFKINVTVDCLQPQLQQTHCVTALIFPDSTCEAINPSWDGSSLKIEGSCDADSVRFNIINTGNDMSTAKNWIVIEDLVMLFSEPEEVDLPAGESKPLAFEKNGSTYRLIAEQSDFHPDNSMPTIAIEGCVDDNMTFETGFFSMFAEDDNNLAKSIDCQENVNVDNIPDQVKSAYPKGYNDENCITTQTELNYHIRFQNTGVDSVERVIVRDTLSELIDISSIELGASSHDFVFEIYDERILKFTFDNIMLPGSSTNEAASNGFVKFRVSQKLDNQIGDVIYNSAAIYFDFDRWINTDETFHTICGELWEEFLDVSTTAVFIPEVDIAVFPNPFSETTTFKMSGLEFQDVNFTIYDLQGRLMRSEVYNGNEFQFQRNQLSSGMYIYRIESEGQPVAVGKIVIE